MVIFNGFDDIPELIVERCDEKKKQIHWLSYPDFMSSIHTSPMVVFRGRYLSAHAYRC
jgi:hypothetical protein